MRTGKYKLRRSELKVNSGSIQSNKIGDNEMNDNESAFRATMALTFLVVGLLAIISHLKKRRKSSQKK